jgi:polysaccharide deacetylase 2 family uncharacterized protein YibQ
MGLGGVLAIYATLFIYAFVVSDSVVEELEHNMATETVMIENPHNYVMKADEEKPVKAAHSDAHHEDKGKHHDPDIKVQNGESKQHEAEHDEHKTSSADHSPPEAIKAPETVKVVPEHDDDASLSDLLTGEKTGRKGLRKAPIKKITEETPQGLVPVKKQNLPTAFEAYRKPFILNKSRHTVAIVIDNFGLSEKLSASILKQMPSPVSLILSPYSARATHWQESARRDGHELWMHLPVQTLDFPRRDPGAKGLLSDASLAYNEERMEWVLSRTSGYAGLASFTDDALRKSSPMFTGFFNQVFDRGLGLLELNTGDHGFVAEIAKAKKAPYAVSHLHLKSFAPNSGEMKMAEAHIQEHKNTIIVVQPTAQNLEQLRNWLMRVEGSGVTIAPASALASLAVE